MNPKHLLLLFVCCTGGLMSAQSLNQARQLFNAGKYEEAKPAFFKLLKQSPNNANYNYWYGACCCETGESTAAESYLKKAASRNVTDAYAYLAEVQAEQYRFEEATESMEKYISLQQKKKADTAGAEKRLEQLRQEARMLKGTEQVTFIDSFVVDKEAFLSAYKIGEEAGLVDSYNHFFDTDDEPGSLLYRTELQHKIFYAAACNGTLRLRSQDREGDTWGEAEPLQGLDTDGNQNYPYVLSDGVTLYYASDGEGSIGGYDIFVTRYNSENNRYLRPENIGMPFNSPANDYLYVLDEYNNLGWFASDRRQPEGKVCIYVFIPNDTRITFNYEQADEADVRQAARIQSIAASQRDAAAVRAARQRLTLLAYRQPTKQPKRDFTFIIDDNTTYYTLDEFKSPQAKRFFMQWQQSRKELAALNETLEAKRLLYRQSNASKRQAMTNELLGMERKAEQMETDTESMTETIRNAEKAFLAK